MKLSVLIPAYNAERFIPRLLNSLITAERPSGFDWEVIVVDNNSTDATSRLINSFKDRLPLLNYLFEPQPGKCHALNRALQDCRSEFVAFLDHDVVVQPNYLVGLAKTIASSQYNVFGGRILPLWETEPPPWLQDGMHLRNSYGGIIAHDYGEEPKPYTAEMRLPVGCNFFCRRSLFDRVGLFNTLLGPRPGLQIAGEESDILRRFQSVGEQLLYAPAATVHHPVDPERATKSYFRYRLFCDGRATYRMSDIKADFPKLLGVPRYLFRTLVESLGSVVLETLKGKPHRSFDSQLEVCYTLGAIYEACRKDSSRLDG
jgi:glycosyltransferase involved in cell wall biosynthesis